MAIAELLDFDNAARSGAVPSLRNTNTIIFADVRRDGRVTLARFALSFLRMSDVQKTAGDDPDFIEIEGAERICISVTPHLETIIPLQTGFVRRARRRQPDRGRHPQRRHSHRRRRRR